MYYKLNRLLNPYAWRSWFTFPNILMLLLCVSLVWLYKNVIQPDNLSIIDIIVLVLAPALIIFLTIDSVCSPCKIIFGGKKKPDVCIYKEKHKKGGKYYRIVVKGGNNEPDIIAEDFEVLFDGLPLNPLLIYLAEDTKECWYLWRFKAEPKCLGARLNDILFRSPESDKLTVLSCFELSEIQGEYVCGKDVYVPENADIGDLDGVNMDVPDDVLLIKKGDGWESWGFCLSSKLPSCRRVTLSAVIIREGNYRLLLNWNREKQRYVETFRGQNLSRRLNCWFCELDGKYGIGGKIWRYYAGSKILQCVYTGRFLSIDFDNGLVHGADGRVYGGR